MLILEVKEGMREGGKARIDMQWESKRNAIMGCDVMSFLSWPRNFIPR
jgi:hypothetical protein